MKKALLGMALALLTPSMVHSDAGILIPRDQAEPNPAILSLEEMEITVQIDNGDARVFVLEVFANHTANIEEGDYVFALPSNATVSDFGVWDGATRIPAVILERKRAEELYEQLRQQSIDPGLLQMGERGAEQASRSAVFSARIVPIPAYGTKRLEFEYHESIPIENLKSYFAVPLRPDAYQAQVARHLRINFELNSAHAIANFQASAKAFPLQIEQSTTRQVKAHFEGENVNLAEDFVATFDLDRAGSDMLQVMTYRDPTPRQPSPAESAPAANPNQSGFFTADALLADNAQQNAKPPKTTVILFDTSLSMQWEQLERSYEALETRSMPTGNSSSRPLLIGSA
jgi:Ca-activated chloride channel homolog